jgi:hypothetical protein
MGLEPTTFCMANGAWMNEQARRARHLMSDFQAPVTGVKSEPGTLFSWRSPR